MAATLVAAEPMSTETREARHEDPVWRDRSDFVIAAEIASEGADREQLWAKQLSEDTFEICCIPFFVYDVALGDVVQTAPAGGRRYIVQNVIRPSGRFVFRVWFGDSFQPRREIADELEALGALLEWSSPNLLAVDAADEELAKVVSGWLLEREQQGHLVYETGKTA
ncbi:MAG: DUF4265 domain-containing protein [Acidimicrobiales bacterium]